MVMMMMMMMRMLFSVPVFLGKAVSFFGGASSPGTARFVPHNAPAEVENLMKKVDSSPLDYETFSRLMEDIP